MDICQISSSHVSLVARRTVYDYEFNMVGMILKFVHILYMYEGIDIKRTNYVNYIDVRSFEDNSWLLFNMHSANIMLI